MSDKAETARTLFQEHIANLTKKVPLKVMLGDGTVTDQESFDPALVRKFFDEFLNVIPGWDNQGVSATAEKDLRRSFIKFEIKEGNYLLSGHMSLQYHALLFYKLDHRVIEIQKELSDISDMIAKLQVQVGPENDKIIEEPGGPVRKIDKSHHFHALSCFRLFLGDNIGDDSISR